MWVQWDDEVKQLFYYNYSDLAYLLDIKVDKHLFRALAQFWNPTYSCFTFGKVDLLPSMEEYIALLRCPKIQADKAYSRAVNVSTFVKKLMSITGMSEQWNYFPLKESVATPRRDDISEENWMEILQNLHDEDVEWRAPWMVPDEILQYRSRQFILVTQGLAQCEFSYRGDNYKKNIREMSNAWNQTHRMKRFAVGPMTTPEYNGWWSKRVNDNIPGQVKKAFDRWKNTCKWSRLS
ncbi:hypothetical protein Goarm_022510 [Gossypium armourianum]|uniref:DUF7745 domain-containing protein n=1 Tax=Gossypium armourianum TaxID=34283 RepID=A0A7J9KHW9_9ROSI|nr:hypothetical protein [Gossypium armourianum]